MSPSSAPSEHHPLADVEGYVVIVSDSSANGDGAEAYADALQLREPERRVDVLHTDKNEEGSRHRLIEKLQAGGVLNKLVIVGGGDGSVHYTVRALLHPDMPAELRGSILTSWALGTACDFYFATQDGSMAQDPLGTLEHPDAHIFDAYPAAITNENGDILDYMTLYWTAGPTAVAAAILASEKHRARKAHWPRRLGKLADMAHGAPALWLPERYNVSLDDGEPTPMAELQVINSDRMAMDSRYPSRLSRQEIYLSTVASNSPLAIGATALRMKLGRTKGTLQPDAVSMKITSDKPVPVQTDGEPGTLAPDEKIIFTPSKRRIRVLATKQDV
jgi:diacylglycerol kinase family enzyme